MSLPLKSVMEILVSRQSKAPLRQVTAVSDAKGPCFVAVSPQEVLSHLNARGPSALSSCVAEEGYPVLHSHLCVH